MEEKSRIKAWPSLKHLDSVCTKHEIEINIFDFFGVITKEDYCVITSAAKQFFIINVSRNKFLTLIDNREASCFGESTC